jgi:hypothetical protein
MAANPTFDPRFRYLALHLHQGRLLFRFHDAVQGMERLEDIEFKARNVRVFGFLL